MVADALNKLHINDNKMLPYRASSATVPAPALGHDNPSADQNFDSSEDEFVDGTPPPSPQGRTSYHSSFSRLSQVRK